MCKNFDLREKIEEAYKHLARATKNCGIATVKV